MSEKLKTAVFAAQGLDAAEREELMRAVAVYEELMRAASQLKAFDWQGLLKIIPNVIAAIAAGTIPGLAPLLPLIIGLTPILNILLPIFIPGVTPIPLPTPGPTPVPPDGDGTIPPTPIP